MTIVFFLLGCLVSAFCGATLVDTLAKIFKWYRDIAYAPYGPVMVLGAVIPGLVGGITAAVRFHAHGMGGGLVVLLLAAPALLALLGLILLVIRVAPSIWIAVSGLSNAISSSLTMVATRTPLDAKQEAEQLRKRLAELEGPNGSAPQE